jgi:hypothetical protein
LPWYNSWAFVKNIINDEAVITTSAPENKYLITPRTRYTPVASAYERSGLPCNKATPGNGNLLSLDSL